MFEPPKPRISVFMPSYNKRGFGVEAVRSVLAQDFSDWELWIMENSTDDGKTRKTLFNYLPLHEDHRIIYEEIEISREQRNQLWPAPWLLNQYYPLANGDIILYISDDDLFMPGLFRSVVDFFDQEPDSLACYFHLVRTKATRPGEGVSWADAFSCIWADEPRGEGRLDCQVDGGQIAYRKSVIDSFTGPLFYEQRGHGASHCDGLHMEEVAKLGIEFKPLKVNGVIHRHTLFSTWSK